MRVLLINYELPPLGGGAGVASEQIALQMAALGHQVTILTSAHRSLPRRERRGGVEIRRIRTLRRGLDRSNLLEIGLFMASACFWALFHPKAETPDAVVAFFGIPGGPPALLLSLRHRIPYVVSLRGGDVPGLSSRIRLYHRVMRPLTLLVWRRAARVIANSRHAAQLARATAPETVIELVPNGVDSEAFAPIDAVRPGEGVRMLYVGRLTRGEKGLDVLLRAVAELSGESGPHLEIHGDGHDRVELEALVRSLGLAHQVSFHGWADRAALPAIYRGADLFTIASREEGMPNVVLEAMASGLPVVGTAIAGIEDLVVDGITGRLVPSEDPAAFAAAVRELAADPELRREMGRAGRRRVEADFTWRRVAEAYLRELG